MTWDSITFDGSNQAEKSYNDGPNTLAHELFHHLGLQHTFGPSAGGYASCTDDDYVADTPSTLGALPSPALRCPGPHALLSALPVRAADCTGRPGH